MKRNQRITVRINKHQRERVEKTIKGKYPDLRNISELLRKALDEFLNSELEET